MLQPAPKVGRNATCGSTTNGSMPSPTMAVKMSLESFDKLDGKWEVVGHSVEHKIHMFVKRLLRPAAVKSRFFYESQEDNQLCFNDP